MADPRKIVRNAKRERRKRIMRHAGGIPENYKNDHEPNTQMRDAIEEAFAEDLCNRVQAEMPRALERVNAEAAERALPVWRKNGIFKE